MAMDQLQEKGDALFGGGGEPIITSISFGQKDGLLCEWAQTIPKGAFSMIVRDVIKAHLLESDYAFPVFPRKKQVAKKSVTKSLSIGKNDYEVYQFIVTIPKFGRANEIKKLLWKYWAQDFAHNKHYVSQNKPKPKAAILASSTHNAGSSIEDALFSIADRMNGHK